MINKFNNRACSSNAAVSAVITSVPVVAVCHAVLLVFQDVVKESLEEHFGPRVDIGPGLASRRRPGARPSVVVAMTDGRGIGGVSKSLADDQHGGALW